MLDAVPRLIYPGPLAPMFRVPASLLAIGLLGLHALVWGRTALRPVFGSPGAAALLLALSIASVPVHEALHVAGYRVVGRAPRTATRVVVRGLMAYAHCAAPMPAGAYRAAIALPGLGLGLLPAAAGLALGLAWLTAYGAFALAGALADARVLWALRRVPSAAPVVFRPEFGPYEIFPLAGRAVT